MQSVRVCLGEELYELITLDSGSTVDIVDSLKLKSEHEALDIINKLETATLAVKERIKELQVSIHKIPLRTSWSFMKEPISEVDKIESLLLRLDALMHQLKIRYPCLPHTFIAVTKIRYGKVGTTNWKFMCSLHMILLCFSFAILPPPQKKEGEKIQKKQYPSKLLVISIQLSCNGRCQLVQFVISFRLRTWLGIIFINLYGYSYKLQSEIN